MNKNRKHKKSWQVFVRTLALCVVFCTTYALILPAITMQEEAVCGFEEHAHSTECYSQQQMALFGCEIPDGAVVVHQHSDLCCDEEGNLICTLEQIGAHVHGEACYEEQTLVCQLSEVEIHTHDETCYGEENDLTCTLPVTVEHIHSETCLVAAEPVLTCTLQEHTHTPACYPLDTDEAAAEYHCGYAVHTHIDSCYQNDGTLACTIPEHTHEAACIVKNLDLSADVEEAALWETEIAELEFTGIWAEDLVTVAKSQLGYKESQRNCELKDEQLFGYTRYGHWYGEKYSQWDDMFVAFCLHYAEIPEESIPYESDTAKWIEKLEENQLYITADGYDPVAGDLIFWDSDDDDIADKSGIVAEVKEEKIAVIAGDTENACVETVNFEAGDDTVTGYCKLPVNPVSQEQWNAAEAVIAALAELPEAETVRENLQKLNADGDKAGYEALRQEVASRMEAAETAYNALDDAQKAKVTGLERLEALKEVCGGENWQQFAPLADDSAALIQLTAHDTQIIRAPKAAEEPETAENAAEAAPVPENAVQNLDTVRFAFTAAAESHYADVSYGEAAVKVELVLPLTQDKAVFDTEAMTWLEDAVLTTETRLINETETTCQVLTGYKRLAADETSGIVVPGSFTEAASVKVVNMVHDEQVVLIVSAAMEHNTWEGVCQTHGQEEKLTVVTEPVPVYAPMDPQTQLANYEAFLLEAEQIKAQGLSDSDQYFAAMELMVRIDQCSSIGGLSDEQYEALTLVITELSSAYTKTVAEPCIGTNWMNIDFSDPVSYGETSNTLKTFAQSRPLKVTQALSLAVYNATFPSAVQIREEGGENVSSEGAVMVSKTIEGTDKENVFDITLQIVTKDEVNEVYKDPDMAVVVVMDISNTMRSNFGSVTRYQAAMTAGENFLKKFAQQNSTLSRVGYVAFNTDAHEVFDLTPCNTTAQANALTTTMKNKTGNIVNRYVDSNGNTTTYYDSKRFTNMQAGLKMASDMLATANNQHKYIIFISDGFPTTYLNSGYTGWDPNTSSGSNKVDGVFYDAVRNVHCDYGTSYSDTAAIKARQLAVNLKKQGTNIFSIGVDVGGQNLWDYHNHAGGMSGGFSVVERRQEATYYNSTGYEIGTKHSVISKTSVTAAEKTAMAQNFKDWLKGSATSGIGSGYYYDSTDLSGLNAAYDDIFQKILELNASSSHLDWVASDPMSDMGVHEVKAMEFISFWDLDSEGNWVLKEDDLTGVSKDGNLYDNTADFHEDTQTIHWDIKKSGYISQAAGDTTTYMCELKYRVRLRNEDDVFVERQSYNTNDVTTLTYRIIEVEGANTSISEQRKVEFPIPAVEGYLSELSFDKIDSYGAPVTGAEFTLSHDTASCGYCRGDGKGYVTVADDIAVSDSEGKVTFTKIPSGHTYTLTETKVPDGYKANNNSYSVTVAYDTLKVTVTDQDGNPLTWEELIENTTSYRLPETGGTGTSFLTFGGLLMIAAACVYFVIQTERKFRRKEERS